jgi:hypothetical protein
MIGTHNDWRSQCAMCCCGHVTSGHCSSHERADSSPIRRQEDPPAESSPFGRAPSGPRHLSCSRTLDSDPHGFDREEERKNGAYPLAAAQNKMGSRAKPATATNQQSPPNPVHSPCLFDLSFRDVEAQYAHQSRYQFVASFSWSKLARITRASDRLIFAASRYAVS